MRVDEIEQFTYGAHYGLYMQILNNARCYIIRSNIKHIIIAVWIAPIYLQFIISLGVDIYIKIVRKNVF